MIPDTEFDEMVLQNLSSGSEYQVDSEKEFAPKVASINSDRDPSRDPRRNKNTLDL